MSREEEAKKAMRRQIYSFISASGKQKDRKVVDWFSKMLRKHEVEPVFATDHPEPRPPAEKIKEYIRKSDLFIAILTRRDKIEGKNLWKGPDWVQNEIGMAVQQKKPFALFVERGVDPSQGIGPSETEYVIFDRGKLPRIKAKTEKMIEALKKEVASKVENQTIEDAVIEEVVTSSLAEGLTSIGRSLINGIYGRLNVSLRMIYLIIALVSVPPAYFVYDFLYGNKIIGPWGNAFCLVVLIILVSFVASAEGTRCKNCKSYFSLIERPVLASDIAKLLKIPDSRRYHKWRCDVCGETKYKAIDRKMRNN